MCKKGQPRFGLLSYEDMMLVDSRDQVQICENLRSVRGWGKMPLSMSLNASHSGEASVLKFQKTL